MLSVHPLLVHFPIALLTISFMFDLAGTIRRRGDITSVGWWMQLVGTAGVLMSVASGLLAKESAQVHGGSGSILETHQEMAFASAVIFSTLVLWRIAMKKAIPENQRWLFFLVYGAGVAVLWTGAWFGGILVYEHGVGVLGR